MVTTPTAARSPEVHRRCNAGATQGQKWDFEGHLLAQGQVNTSGNFTGDRTTYAYDANGMRLSQATVNTTGAVTDATSYLWDGDRVSEERDENGVLQASYEHGQELGPLRLLRKSGASVQAGYFGGDGLDSTRQLLNEAGDHAEVGAINEVMKARPGASLSEMAVMVLRGRGNTEGNPGDPFNRCNNCIDVTDGAWAMADPLSSWIGGLLGSNYWMPEGTSWGSSADD